MRLARSVFAISALVTGCATNSVWVRQGASNEDFQMDAGQCKAQAFSIPGAPPMQIAIVYNSCMQGKGWHQERAP